MIEASVRIYFGKSSRSTAFDERQSTHFLHSAPTAAFDSGEKLRYLLART